MQSYLTRCVTCGSNTSKQYARAHDQQCKYCTEQNAAESGPVLNQSRERHASREEQYARYIDCGPAAWDDR